MAYVAQFCLLLWKNFIIQRRKVIVTCLEVGLPTLFALILIFIRQRVEFTKFNNHTEWREFQVDSSFPRMFRPFDWSDNHQWQLYYTPNLTVTDTLMRQIANHLNIMCESKNCSITGISGYADETSMVSDFMRKNGSGVPVLAGVVFSNITGLIDPAGNAGVIPTTYTVRFPSTLRGANSKFNINPLNNNNNWFTQLMFPMFQKVGPRSLNSIQDGPPGYLEQGFLVLQYTIDMAIVELLVNRSSTAAKCNVSVDLRRFPYPPYVDDNFVLVIQQQFPFVIMLSFVFCSMQIVKDLVYEKEQKLKESMKMMGLANWLHWTAWFVKYFLFLLISVAIETVFFIINTGKNGSVIGYTSPGILFIFLLVYSVATISFCFAISTFFSKANSAAAAGGVIFFITYIPYFFIQQRYDTMSWPAKIVCCLLSNVAMSLGGQVIGIFEGTGAGVQFSNINQSVSVDDDFKMINVICMLLFDSLLYMLIAWYVEAVRPGEYGIPRPFYFPFQKSYWCGTRMKSKGSVEARTSQTLYISDGFVSQSDDADDSLLVPSSDASDSSRVQTASLGEFFESGPQGLKAGISIINLRKEFGSGSNRKVAVNNMQLNMFEGQITALLGHNGAGKTTTMSILTGFFPPTSGTAIVNGFDILQDIDGVRKSLGLCPQHNILFDELTVEEHLYFFTKLKGFPADQVDAEVNRMIKDTGLEAKRKTRAATLSGGMKRKLSVGIALIAGSKVVILDEPTSGMDPDARRQTWDLLQHHRVGRTMVLSTHFMDEADLLGDRIAIMANGVVRCCGTSLFLKKKYGAGYHMAIVKEPSCNVKEVTRVVQSHVEGACLENDAGAELSFVLPQESKQHFSALFAYLDQNRSSLGIASYGASVTTMEEVFLRVGEQVNGDSADDNKASVDGSSSHSGAASDGFAVDADDVCLLSATEKNVGSTLLLQQFVAMFLKHMRYSLRSWLLSTSQLLVPLLFTILALVVIKTVPGPQDSPPLDLDLSKLAGSYVSYSNDVNGTGRDFAATYASSIQRQFPSTHLAYVNNASQTFAAKPDMIDFLVNEGKRSIATYSSRYAIALDVISEERSSATEKAISVLAYFNNQGYHAAAISLNAFTNALLQYVLGNSSFKLTARNHPMPRNISEVLNDEVTQGFQGFAIAVNLLFGMSFLAASFVLFLVRERAVKAKHCQFVSGVNAVVFWLATFVWNFICFLVPCIAIVVAFGAFDIVPFWINGRFMGVILLMLLYAWAMLPFMYLLSFIFTVPSTGLVWLTMFNILSGIATILAVGILSIPQLGTENLSRVLKWIFITILPNFCLGQGLEDFYSNYEFMNMCKPKLPYCFLPVKNPCCKATCGDFCIEFTENCLSLESGGIGRYLLFLVFQGFLYFSLLVLIESRLLTRLAVGLRRVCCRGHAISTSSAVSASAIQEDDDVLEEQRRVNTTPLSQLLETDTVTVTGLTKVYRGRNGALVAVDKLSFGARRGECFGLLGINGAGKTSTFQMLTGDEMVSSGDAFIGGFSILRNIHQVRKQIGYCPQFDALIDQSTGRETLYMYARLRGINESMIDIAVQKLTDELLLRPHIDRLVKTYSGGNKRKLSTAVALIGDPSVIFLDEPSTGLDPVARRHLWNSLSRVCSNGQTLVFTSHSMEECDALCTQIAIMVNGRLKCIGSPQHLKSKFGDGYTVIAKVLSNDVENDVTQLCRHVETTFPGSHLKDVHHGLVHYHVPRSPTTSLARLFAEMEAVRDRFSVDDYSVSQTTLEQVFINFARTQRPPGDDQQSGCCNLQLCNFF